MTSAVREVSREEPPATGRVGGDNGGGGGGLEVRLRHVEIQLAGIDNQLKHVATKAQLAKVDNQLEHVATKAWVLGSVLGGMGMIASAAVAIVMMYLRAP